MKTNCARVLELSNRCLPCLASTVSSFLAFGVRILRRLARMLTFPSQVPDFIVFHRQKRASDSCSACRHLFLRTLSILSQLSHFKREATASCTAHETPIVPRFFALYRETRFFSKINICATLSLLRRRVWHRAQASRSTSEPVPLLLTLFAALPLPYPYPLCILPPTEMTNNDNNLGMSADSGAGQAPSPDESSGGGGASTGAAPASAQEISLEEFSELQSRAAKADENWEKYVRVVADFDNFKKRAARERLDAIKYANEALIEKLLPIVDNFEAALAAANSPQASVASLDSLKTGVNMIYTQLKSFLSENGAEEIDALNKPFDPNLHEAVSQQATEDAPEGQVVQQMRKGYKYRDRLIRPAMVVVAKKP